MSQLRQDPPELPLSDTGAAPGVTSQKPPLQTPSVQNLAKLAQKISLSFAHNINN